MMNLAPWTRRRGNVVKHTDPFNELLKGFYNDDWLTGKVEGLNPRFDVVETEKEYKLTAELPGIEKDDFEITLENDILTIKGEKKEEKEEKGKNYHMTERRYGAFQRRFRMPETIDRDHIKAELDKGLLKVDIPKDAEAAEKTVRKIDVNKEER